jgi:hypothetical protein
MMIILAAVATTASPALAHGGKEHAATEFTAFKALGKAADLYNRLLSSGKLDESWETDLENVTISAPPHSGSKEFVVSFRRTQGKPQTVFFFFTAEGKYAGSNFTGP